MFCARSLLKRSLGRIYASRYSTNAFSPPQKGDRVIVGMSGGIDSSVSAKLLAQQDYDLSAVFMRNWDTRDEYGTSEKGCEWEKDWADVQKVCRAYDIPCQMVDLSKEYWTRVFEPSLRQWEDGITPNPDVWCNREIKFGALLEHLPVRDPKKPPWLATGHYARRDWSSPRPRLLRSADPRKDQTYYLSSITEGGLASALFPIGHLTKSEVKVIANDGVMPSEVLERDESMGLCFIGQKNRTDFKHFLSSYIPPSPGPLKLLSSGKEVGRHNGLWSFTIGENVRITGMPERLFAVRKDIPSNTIFVGPAREPALLCSAVQSHAFTWIWPDDPPEGISAPGGARLFAQVRHKMPPVQCTVTSMHDDAVRVDFDEELKGVAAGQVVALWDGDWCLGCGTISTTM
ncbi:unnamed protein product [Mycena citricolor]|uniref:tRNA-5-taurinomethyluridine 2-sulfurtransferase n=1 Tax=Mycena citricolor TaxID=2018698 RepID=A0AAD2H904_9AGAR|nr:unnamed protein product [Mycena citricolor]